jgi:hypothetical protein
MMRSAALVATWLSLSSLGCTVTAVSAGDDPRPSNTCQNDSECDSGSCGAGVCQAGNGQLEALLISVTPPSDSTLPHLTYVTHLADIPPGGGSKDIALSGPSRVTGSLVMPEKAVCYPSFLSDDPSKPIFGAPDGKSLPVQVTFALRERLLGVPQQLYFARTGEDNDQGAYLFDVNVPAGEYDVYLVPPRTGLDCPVPPQLRRGWSIKGGDFAVPFPVAAISSLSLRVRWPSTTQSLRGWVADIIEPLGGRAISTEAILQEPGEGSIEYVAPLAYSEVVAPESSEPTIEAASDLLRLRPPANLIAPTIFLDRSALGLFGTERVTIEGFTRYPAAVTVEGQVARADDGRPVRGSVTLVSTEIFGVDAGIFASFQASATVDTRGVFRVEVPPGRYRVQAEPPLTAGVAPVEGALAAYETVWEIPADVAFQAGKLLELPPMNQLVGQSRFQGAEVHAVATPLTTLPFEEAFGAGAFLPRATSGLVDAAGKFVVQADPGKFDVSVQAPESLGFAWYVRPGVEVGEGTHDLGRIALPAPVALTGTVTAVIGETQAVMASAAVRAYVYLDKDLAYTADPKQAVSVMQVAETRADDAGAFRLLLPSSITASK